MGDIFEWLCKNKLKLNAGKTKIMVLTNKTSTTKDVIKNSIDGGEIERATLVWSKKKLSFEFSIEAS
jgi:hypothetical protein